MEAEATYDTPWEYTAAARLSNARPWAVPASSRPILVTARRDGASAVLNANGFIQSVVKGKKKKERQNLQPQSPLPGLRAKANSNLPTRRSKSTRPESNPTASSVRKAPMSVWEPRGPEADTRDPSEYEEPWDRQRASIAQVQLRESLTVSVPSRPASHTYEGLWEASSGSAMAQDRSSISPRERERDTSSASPASSSSTWSSSGSKASKSSLSSASVPNDVVPPPGLVRPWPPSDFAGSPQGRPSSVSATSPAVSSGSSTTLAKTPATPIMETAFLTSAAPKSSRLSREEEERERVIQRLCQDLDELHPTIPAQPRSRNPFPPVAHHSTSAFHKVSPKLSPSAGSTGSAAVGGQYDNVAESISQAKTESSSKIISDSPVSSSSKTSTTQTIEPEPAVDYDVPWEFCNQKKLTRLLQKGATKKEGESGDRGRLRLNLSGLGSAAGEGGEESPLTPPELSGPLELADWFHGRINRLEAEARLASAPEGSYLVRLCQPQVKKESKDGPAAKTLPPPEYALSLKSAAGFMHMKIQEKALTPSGGSGDQKAPSHWVLGYFSSPFPTIPKMLSYYTVHKLPIKGADHLNLRQPVKDPLL